MLEACPSRYQTLDTTIRPASTNTRHPTLRPLLLRSRGHNEETASEYTHSTKNEKLSLDFTQRIERKLAEYNASQNVIKRWIFEICSWLVSAVSMGAMIGIYLSLQDERLLRVDEQLTYTNILGKVASAALIVPTSEALGQLKWNWFHQSKTMWDFEIFDKASR
jgi:hypothetical protein